MKNYVVEDESWEPSGILASMAFTVVLACDESPQLKAPPVFSGDWALNDQGWKRARGYNLPLRAEGIKMEIGK